ncbi:MAG TPA: TonB-dependent receptor [Vicinamibacterales bacterium]|nr:TonB-dependent receptor [Vicinamibacterales bacterium]
MKISRIMRMGIGVLLILVAQVLPALAQTEGRFTGAVLDSSGSAVPGATVLVKNEKTGEERTVTSNTQGRYLVPNLKPSIYTIKVTIASFAPLQYTGMPLQASQEFPLDLQLQPAGVSETVTVTGETATIDLSSARLGVNVSERDVKNLPVNGRQMSQLMLQAPGSLNSGTGTWQDVRFSGRAVEQNAIRYDGVEGSAIIDAAPGNLNGEIATPFKLQASLENVQEFRVESNSYPAEHGTGSGGQVNVVTKSGSNQFRGAVFEYYRNDKLDAPNYFDTLAGLPKSKLNQHQFGGSIGGPIAKDRAFFFGSVESYKLKAGVNFVEGVPSAAAWSRAVPAIAALRPGFTAPGAIILPGASANPDFDIAQLQGLQDVKETSYSARVDFRLRSNWSSYVRVFHDEGKSVQPEGVSGRNVVITDDPSNAIFALQGTIGGTMQNEFKVGYNAAPTNIVGSAPVVNGIDFGGFALNLSGSVANTGIAGQGNSSGIAVPGGLVRANSATNGHAQPYDPYSISLIDSLSAIRGNHFLKAGGEFRRIRMTTDRIGGITYTFSNITAFLANQASTVQYLGDLSAPSPFNNGATGPRHTRQEYYVAYAQDEWHVAPKATLNYGLRYDYYTPMREANDLIVKFNIDTGVIDPNTTRLFESKTNNFQPRVSFTYAPGRTVFRAGAGMFVGPGQTEDQIQPIESDRISSTISNGAFPLDVAAVVAGFTSNPNNRQYQPRAYANEYSVPERIYQYTGSVQQELGGRYTASAAYMGSQGHNLFLRSVANRITQVVTNPNPAANAFVIREFSIVQRDAAGNITGVQNPFAEVDYKTSGGHDSYNAMMLQLSRRASTGVSLNVQYTLGKSKGNTAGSNEALTSGNVARALSEFDYDNGYNNFDVRHTFNLSLLYPLPYGRGRTYGQNASALSQALLGGWDIGGIVNARSGLPVNVIIVRPDFLYRDASGTVFVNPAADRVAIINTPGGGNSRNIRRPDLVAGVDPFITDGGVVFLNPAAFATPAPGTFGNLERNSIHGPNFKQVDFFFAKHFSSGGRTDVEFRGEVFNLFDTVNFASPVGTLPNALPTAATTEANRVQPGQPYTAAAAGTFGRLTSTVGRTVGLGTPRQIQFALRFSF